MSVSVLAAALILRLCQTQPGRIRQTEETERGRERRVNPVDVSKTDTVLTPFGKHIKGGQVTCTLDFASTVRLLIQIASPSTCRTPNCTRLASLPTPNSISDQSACFVVVETAPLLCIQIPLPTLFLTSTSPKTSTMSQTAGPSTARTGGAAGGRREATLEATYRLQVAFISRFPCHPWTFLTF
jgi:hypothetical protein